MLRLTNQLTGPKLAGWARASLFIASKFAPFIRGVMRKTHAQYGCAAKNRPLDKYELYVSAVVPVLISCYF